MFCEKCGAQIPNDSRFCLTCGAPAHAIGKAPMTPEKEKKVKIGVTVGAIIVILGILAAIFLPMLGGNKNPTDPIDHYFNAYRSGDYGELQKCYPAGLLEAYAYRYDSSEFELRSSLQSTHARLVAEGMADFSYRVLDIEQFDWEDLDDLREELSRKSSGVIIPSKITAARSYYIEITFGPFTSDYERESFTVFCYDGKWYLDPDEIF